MKRFLSLILLVTVLLSTCTFATYADGALPLGDISTEPMEPVERPKQPLTITDTIKQTLSEKAKADFEEWLDEEGSTSPRLRQTEKVKYWQAINIELYLEQE